jgi:lipopolysaccharide/colanic/teichoic acid biosynthesis glycosyltransferase
MSTLRAVETPSLETLQPAAVVTDSWLRRVVDITVSAVALALISPVLLAIAAAVKLDSRGPALYRQQRVGRKRRVFAILKFRSMVADAERIGPLVSGRKDPRITRVGAFLRASKLDELPQLINVLRGDMTLIGPRAEVERYIPHYTPEELQLLTVRPGLTGLGQLFFAEEQAADLDQVDDPDAYYVNRQLHDKLALDLEYLYRRSLWVDVKMIARTAALPFTGRRAAAPTDHP